MYNYLHYFIIIWYYFIYIYLNGKNTAALLVGFGFSFWLGISHWILVAQHALGISHWVLVMYLYIIVFIWIGVSTIFIFCYIYIYIYIYIYKKQVLYSYIWLTERCYKYFFRYSNIPIYQYTLWLIRYYDVYQSITIWLIMTKANINTINKLPYGGRCKIRFNQLYRIYLNHSTDFGV